MKKSNGKSKGGKRPGAGRKPVTERKIAVTVYVTAKQLQKFADIKASILNFVQSYPWPIRGKGPLNPDEAHIADVKKLLDTPRMKNKIKNEGLRLLDRPIEYTPQVKKKLKMAAEHLFETGTAILPHDPEKMPVDPFSEEGQRLIQLFRDQITAQIEAIKAEKCPPERNTPLGKKSWQIEQNKRIAELQKQLG